MLVMEKVKVDSELSLLWQWDGIDGVAEGGYYLERILVGLDWKFERDGADVAEVHGFPEAWGQVHVPDVDGGFLLAEIDPWKLEGDWGAQLVAGYRAESGAFCWAGVTAGRVPAPIEYGGGDMLVMLADGRGVPLMGGEDGYPTLRDAVYGAERWLSALRGELEVLLRVNPTAAEYAGRTVDPEVVATAERHGGVGMRIESWHKLGDSGTHSLVGIVVLS